MKPLELRRDESEDENDWKDDSAGFSKRSKKVLLQDSSEESGSEHSQSESDDEVKLMDSDKLKEVTNGIANDEDEGGAELGPNSGDNVSKFDIHQEGEKFTSFGLDEELHEGRFDENENFIKYASDEDKDQDVWLEGIKEEDIRKAQRAEMQRDKDKASKRPEVHLEPTEDILRKVIECLNPSETPREWLQRQNLRRKSGRSAAFKQASRLRDSAKISEFTSLVTSLEAYGYKEVYEMSREEFMREYKFETGEQLEIKRGQKRPLESDASESGSENDNGNDHDYGIGNDNNKLWEFKWTNKDTVYGPYSRKQISAWKDTYFKDRAYVRKVGDTEFVHISKWTT